MAAQFLDRRNRVLGIAGTIAVHVVVIAGLLLLSPRFKSLPAPEPGLVAVHLTQPPPPEPPPPPDEIDEGAAAPPSRDVDEAPAPPPPPRPLATPTPAEVSPDPGADSGAGLGPAPGNGAGVGGEGSGSGAGGQGGGRGAGRVIPPQRIEGGFTRSDYRRAGAPRDAFGTVVVGFRVRSDGTVDRCSVIRSSGYREFDDTTCRLIEQRFRYRPARDASGQPIDWNIRTDFTWTPR